MQGDCGLYERAPGGHYLLSGVCRQSVLYLRQHTERICRLAVCRHSASSGQYTYLAGSSVQQISCLLYTSDRIIKGLAEYYLTKPQYKVYFHIVGELSGERERQEILPIIKQNALEPYVILYGNMHGNDLDQLFSKADMGIGSLGRHRSGITHIKTLKNSEYAARGIPFVYSEIDADFDHCNYCLLYTSRCV